MRAYEFNYCRLPFYFSRVNNGCTVDLNATVGSSWLFSNSIYRKPNTKRTEFSTGHTFTERASAERTAHCIIHEWTRRSRRESDFHQFIIIIHKCFIVKHHIINGLPLCFHLMLIEFLLKWTRLMGELTVH